MKFGRPEWAAIPLRLVMGIILVVSGYGKISHMSDTVAFFAKYDFPIPLATAWFIAVLELFGGAALSALLEAAMHAARQSTRLLASLGTTMAKR